MIRRDHGMDRDLVEESVALLSPSGEDHLGGIGTAGAAVAAGVVAASAKPDAGTMPHIARRSPPNGDGRGADEVSAAAANETHAGPDKEQTLYAEREQEEPSSLVKAVLRTGLSISTILIFLYVFLWVCNTVAIKYAQQQSAHGYNFDLFAAICLTELLKFLLSFGYYLYSFGARPLDVLSLLRSRVDVGKKYAIPAVIYMIYNVLILQNMLQFDPGVYRVLINFRVVTSGLLFQLFFNKRLGPRKWFALALLTVGCAICRFDSFKLHRMAPLLLVMFQAFLSSLGGVVNEFLFKSEAGLHFLVQNMYLYGWGTIVNLLAAIILRGPIAVVNGDWFEGFDLYAFWVVFFAALGGFSTSLILKFLTVIHKEFSNGLEMVAVSVLSAVLFGTALPPTLLIAIVFVWSGMYIYNSSP